MRMAGIGAIFRVQGLVYHLRTFGAASILSLGVLVHVARSILSGLRLERLTIDRCFFIVLFLLPNLDRNHGEQSIPNSSPPNNSCNRRSDDLILADRQLRLRRR